MAGAAFKDPETVKVLAHFTPILVDGDVEKKITAKYGVSGYPNTVFADAKGKAVKSVSGAVPTNTFKNAAEAAAKKAKKGKPSKEFKALQKADAELTKALDKDSPSKAIAAVKKIEKIGRKGHFADRAAGVREKYTKAGMAAVAAAEGALADDPATAEKKAKAVLREYRGMGEVEAAAKKVVAAAKAAAEANTD